MRAIELIGKLALRTEPARGDDRSYCMGSGVEITNVTPTHVYVSRGLGAKPTALPKEYDDDNWVLYEPYPPTVSRAHEEEAADAAAEERWRLPLPGD